MKTHVIYIPGLGDRYDRFRVWALKSWKLWGVSTQHVPMVWYDGASMSAKLVRITTAIGHAPEGSRIVLIGESAGATLALKASAAPRVARVITLCGVARPDTPVSAYLRRRAPALDNGVRNLAESYAIDVHSVRAAADGVVGRRFSVLEGASEHVIWSVGHLTTIALCLTIYAPIISAIAKMHHK